MTSLEIIKKLCEKNNTSISALEKELGYGNGSLSKAKAIPSERIYEISLYFNVRMEDLMPRDNSEDVIRTCPDCGITYDCSDKESMNSHKKEHLLWEKAYNKFGELHCDYYINELIKAKNRNIRDNINNSLSVRCEAEMKVLRCLFSRSVQYNNYNLNHCIFDEYVAMMMYGKCYRAQIGEEIYHEIVKKYGTMPGIEDGKSIYIVPKERKSKLTSRDKRDISKDIDSIMEKLSLKEYGPAAYKGEELSEESAILFKKELEIALERLKLINKEKYNPNKNKK